VRVLIAIMTADTGMEQPDRHDKTCRRVRLLACFDHRRVMNSADVADAMERTRKSIGESRDIHCSLDHRGTGTAPAPALLVCFRLLAGSAAEFVDRDTTLLTGPMRVLVTESTGEDG